MRGRRSTSPTFARPDFPGELMAADDEQGRQSGDLGRIPELLTDSRGVLLAFSSIDDHQFRCRGGSKRRPRIRRSRACRRIPNPKGAARRGQAHLRNPRRQSLCSCLPSLFFLVRAQGNHLARSFTAELSDSSSNIRKLTHIHSTATGKTDSIALRRPLSSSRKRCRSCSSSCWARPR